MSTSAVDQFDFRQKVNRMQSETDRQLVRMQHTLDSHDDKLRLQQQSQDEIKTTVERLTAVLESYRQQLHQQGLTLHNRPATQAAL